MPKNSNFENVPKKFWKYAIKFDNFENVPKILKAWTKCFEDMPKIFEN
jgi:hypothetical protein